MADRGTLCIVLRFDSRYSTALHAPFDLRLVEAADGPERGQRILQMSNPAGFALDVEIDRGMGIGRASHHGEPFAWRSPTGDPVLPRVAANDEAGLAPLRSFSGLLVTGGLDHAFAPQTRDAGRYGYPGRSQAHHPLHGRIGHLPTSHFNYGVTQNSNASPTAFVEGTVRQVALFGEHIELTRRIEIDLHTSTLRLRDHVTNLGSVNTPHQLLWHINVGWPMLDEEATIQIHGRGQPSSQYPNPTTMPPPADAAEEDVIAFDRRDVDPNTPAAEVRRPGRTLSIFVDPDEMPWLVRWLNPRAGSYALGLEPSTHAPHENVWRDDAGERDLLKPGETRHYHLSLDVSDTD